MTAIGADAFNACSALTLTVPDDSYAMTWAAEKGIPFVIAE